MDIVFLHGGGQGSWIWDETLAALEAQAPGAHRCLALDVPGCGTKRGRDTAAISYPELVAELCDDVRRAGMAGATLVGHSQAGGAIPAMIAHDPALFGRVIYISCLAAVPDQISGATVLAQHKSPESPLFGILGNPDVPMIEQYRAMFCNDMGPAQAEAFLGRLLRDAWPQSSYTWTGWHYEHLAGVPSTYVLCLEDRILLPDFQEAFAARFRCNRVLRIDAGHQAQNTRPHALAEIIRLEAEPPA